MPHCSPKARHWGDGSETRGCCGALCAKEHLQPLVLNSFTSYDNHHLGRYVQAGGSRGKGRCAGLCLSKSLTKKKKKERKEKKA